MKRIYSLLFIALLMNIGSINYVSATEDTTIETNTFDSTSLEEYLTTEMKQGDTLDLASYYTGDGTLSITVLSGTAQVDVTNLWFTSEGTVTFMVQDELQEYGTYTVTVISNVVPSLSFDKTTVNIVKGETVTLLLKFVPQDSLIVSNIYEIIFTYEGTGKVEIEEITDENNTNIIGYRITGVSSGTITLKANVKDSTNEPAVVTVNVLGGTITPNNIEEAVATLSNVKLGPATSDSMPISIYVILIVISISGGIYNKRKIC
jgi:hypothetical protein